MKSIKTANSNDQKKIKNTLVRPLSLEKLPLQKLNELSGRIFTTPLKKFCYQSHNKKNRIKVLCNQKAAEEYCLNTSKFEAISTSTEESENEIFFKKLVLEKQKLSNNSRSPLYDGEGELGLSSKINAPENLGLLKEGPTIGVKSLSKYYQKRIKSPQERLNKLEKLRSFEREKYEKELEKVFNCEEGILENRQKNNIEAHLFEIILENLREKQRKLKEENFANNNSTFKISDHTETEESESLIDSLSLSCFSKIMEI